MQLKKENSDEILKIRVTKSEKEYIKQVADKKGITLTKLVKSAINSYLNIETKKTAIETIAKLEKEIGNKQETIEKYRELNEVTDMTEIIAMAEENLELTYKQKRELEKEINGIN